MSEQTPPVQSQSKQGETHARRKIREAAERHGFEIVEMQWEPWIAASEMSGIGGGWMVNLRDGDYVEFLSAAEAEEAFALHDTARERSSAEPCPMGCGFATDDPYGGPCSRCWQATDGGGRDARDQELL